ncbi:MAG TPA: hypothetical protein VIO64_21955 [Pseudobacteroides sp.]|uniref:hypothetical protein n=1 Tax=Pseudobacteroides sp. TaxID=1968840 RepID=UPI002F94F2E1
MEKIKLLTVFLLIIALSSGCSIGKENNTPIENSKVNQSSDADKELSKAANQVSEPKTENANSGVLLGLSTGGNDANNGISSYRTLWIAPKDNTISLVAEGKKILVPYGQEWWFIEGIKFNDSKKSEYASDPDELDTVSINDLNSYPAAKGSPTDGNINKYAQQLLSQNKAASENRKLLFVGDKYAAIASDYYYNTGGTMRPYLKDVYVVEINNINRNYENLNPEDNLILSSKDESKIKKVSILQVLGNQVQQYISKYKNENISEDEQSLYGNSPEVKNVTDEYGWSIVRRNGMWSPQLAKKWVFSNWSTFSYNLTLADLPINVPKSVVTYNKLTPGWETIRKAVPGAVDAVSSPAKDMLVVFTQDNLLVYTNPLKGIAKPILTIKLNKNEHIIMTHWATGKYVDKWTQEVRKYLK